MRGRSMNLGAVLGLTACFLAPVVVARAMPAQPAGIAVAQANPSPGPATPPRPAGAEPSAPANPPPAPSPAPPAPGKGDPFAGLPTLLPGPSEPGNIDEVTLPAKPVAVVSGTSTWDDGFKLLFDTFRQIADELGKAGLKPAGRPLTVFLDTDDMSFRFEAMVPIDSVPVDKKTLTPEIRFGTTPSGKALRFTHKAPYDDIDNTYEAITAYLDAKGITVKDAFIEEYASEPKDTADVDLEINIYVQPK